MSLRSVLLIVAALGVALLVFPALASAWLLNSANASLSRALSLPGDAPDRSAALSTSIRTISQARQFSDSTRLTLAQARTYLADGDALQALAAFDSARAVDSDPITEFARANAAWQTNQKDQAYTYWRAAGAGTYFTQTAYRAADRHSWPEMKAAASIAVALDANSANAAFLLADAQSHDGAPSDQVLAGLDQALSLTTDRELQSTILSRKGEVLLDRGDIRQALDVFEQAMRTAPLDARPRTDHAIAASRLRTDSRGADVALLRQVIADSPWYTAAYIALADRAEAAGDVPGAEGWLNEGLKRNPNDAHLLTALGKFYARQGQLDRARETLTSALKFEVHADDLLAIAQSLGELSAR